MLRQRWMIGAAIAVGTVLILGVIVKARGSSLSLPEVAAMPRNEDDRWLQRYHQINNAVSAKPVAVVLGSAFVEDWFKSPAFDQHFGRYRMLNAGIRKDTIENTVWRVRNGLFDLQQPKIVVIAVSAEYLDGHSPQEVAGGIAQIIETVQSRASRAKIIVLGIPQAAPEATKIAATNKLLRRVASDHEVVYGRVRPGSDGRVDFARLSAAVAPRVEVAVRGVVKTAR